MGVVSLRETKETVGVEIFAPATDVATGTDKVFYTVPVNYNGMDLTAIHAEVKTAGTTGVTTVDVNKNGTTMLSTKLTIDSGETGSDEGDIPVVIDTAQDDVSTNDVITVDVDTITDTAPKGLFLRMTFGIP